MKPRCQGAKTLGHFTSFDCRLDDGHDGFCEPYVAPTVDEWRALGVRVESAEAMSEKWVEIAAGWQEHSYSSLDREMAASADHARLQAELDALRAILASGCDACAHAAPKHPVSQEATLAEMRGALDDDEPERTDP